MISKRKKGRNKEQIRQSNWQFFIHVSPFATEWHRENFLCWLYFHTFRMRTINTVESTLFLPQDPHHQEINSTVKFEDNHFTVLLPNPVETGDYTCEIANPQDTCLPKTSPLLQPASVHIFGCATQLDVCSAELTSLRVFLLITCYVLNIY
jgi:hypothetical protein